MGHSGRRGLRKGLTDASGGLKGCCGKEMCPWVGNAAAQIPAQYNEELSNWKSYSNLQGADLREEEFTNSFFFFFLIGELFLQMIFTWKPP